MMDCTFDSLLLLPPRRTLQELISRAKVRAIFTLKAVNLAKTSVIFRIFFFLFGFFWVCEIKLSRRRNSGGGRGGERGESELGGERCCCSSCANECESGQAAGMGRTLLGRSMGAV